MFSNEYFLYLIKSKKGLLIFEGLLVLLMILAVDRYGIWLFLALSIVMSYFLSCNVFSFVHSKKAVDTYFSLPISRKAMLITGILFATLFSSVPMLIGILIKEFIIFRTLLNGVLFLVIGLVMVLIIVMFNVSMYLIGNNHVDGTILLTAYTLLPLFLYLAGYVFLEVFVAGYDGVYLDNVAYLSPSFMYIITYVDLIEYDEIVYLADYLPVAVSFVAYGGLSAYVLKKEFIERKVERAESISKNLFAYPVVIGVYMSLMMFGISSNFDMTFSFFGEYFGLYLVLFAAFVAAMFLFKRKFEFNWKMPAIYVGVLILTLIVAVLANLTRGFGIAYTYTLDQSAIRYEARYYGIENEAINDWANEQTGNTGEIYSITICATNIEKDHLLLKDETLALLKEKHVEAIENYYDDEEYYGGTLTVQDGCEINGDGLLYTGYHNYYTPPELTVEDLETLKKDPNVKFTFEYDNGDYYGDESIEPELYW